MARDFAYYERCYRSRGLFVCLSFSVCVRAQCSNGRRYRHDFFCITVDIAIVMSLPDHFKIWLTLVNPLVSKFCSILISITYSVDLSVGDIRWQIATENCPKCDRFLLHTSDVAFCQITLTLNCIALYCQSVRFYRTSVRPSVCTRYQDVMSTLFRLW